MRGLPAIVLLGHYGAGGREGGVVGVVDLDHILAMEHDTSPLKTALRIYR